MGVIGGTKSNVDKRPILKRARKGANMSRKGLLEQRRQSLAAKRQANEAQRAEAKKLKVQRAMTLHNKKTHKLFDRSILQCVQDGLVESIQSLGETVTPLSLFMAAFTALSKSPEKLHIPYVLAIMSACAPRLSQGILFHQLEPSIALAEQIIAENVASNHLVVAKTMKFVQQLILSISAPNTKVLDVFCRLEPNKLQVDTMRMFVVTFRKLLESAALSAGKQLNSSVERKKDRETGAYVLTDSERLFVEGLPRLLTLSVGIFIDAPATVVSTTVTELKGLFNRTISPYIVESAEGQEMIESMISTQLLELLKPQCQLYWGYALEILETLFNRINYIKRTHVSNRVPLTQRFSSVSFLLRVLNKMRQVDDSQLNGKIERAMVAIGKGMAVQNFMEIISFDPRKAYEGEVSGIDNDDLWATSYVLNVIRRIASHDSLPYFVEHFFPLIQFVRGVVQEYDRQRQPDIAARWSSLLIQYWRIAVGFCHYPRVITKESFVELAKQLVGLLSQPLYVDTSATALHVLCDGYYQLSQTDSFDDYEETESADMGNNVDKNDAEEEEEERLEYDERDASGKARGPRGPRAIQTKNTLEEDHYFLSMNDALWNPSLYHGISQSDAKFVCENIIGKFSSNIMPKLCNTFETHSSTAVLLCIQSFSKVCTADVMNVILKGILALGSNISKQTKEKEPSASFAKAGHAPLTSKRRMILDISCAIVPQLQVEFVETLYNDIIEPVLLDPAPESRILQKKAYKLLLALFEHRVKDIFPFFPRIASLLSAGRQHVTISGIKMRLRCLAWALDACKMYHPEQLTTMIRGTVGEVIMLARERSSETRTASMDLIEKMHRYLVGAGCHVNTLLHLVLAGLSGKTPLMVSSSLVAMAKLIHLTHQELPEDDLNASIALGFRMMESAALEVRSAASMFARMVLKIMKRCRRVAAAVEKALPKLLMAIALVTSQPHVSSNTRMQMRLILEKCIKRFGIERLEPIFPMGSKNFLRYTQKMLKREQKKEDRDLKKRAGEKKNEFDRLFMGATLKAGTEEDDAERDLLQAGALSSFVSKYSAPSLLDAFGHSSQKYDFDDNGEDELDTMHLDFHDGKLHIMSMDEKRREDDKRQRQEMAQRLLGSGKGMSNADALNARAVGMGGKRSRTDAEDLENDELLRRYGSKVTDEGAKRAVSNLSTRVAPGANQIEKLRDQKNEKRILKRMRVEKDLQKGDEFIGAGDGDVKRGSVDPFAYVPLNRAYMNRRHKRDAIQRFKAVSHQHLAGNKAKVVAASARKKKNGK